MESFTGEIYEDWMKSAQEKKYKEVILDFILPLKDRVDFRKDRILDMGIGKGWFEKKLFERGMQPNVIGVDIENMDLATRGVEFIIGSGNYLPFKGRSFKFVVSFETIHLLKRPAEIERVIQDGGYLLVSTHCNERNLNDKKKKIDSMFGLKVVKEEVVGDPREELSYVALLKRGP